MRSLLSPSRAAQPCPSPVEIWKLLLTHLLELHYGLTLNGTPLSDESVILDQIEAGVSLCDAINALVEEYDLVRTDRNGFNVMEQSPLISSIDILRARRATGLMKRSGYQTITRATNGHHALQSKH
ncbi:TA system toxin CbtA family protein [Lelliottia wanjuensis]|uniref:TA system toxin CbtA family protein n=1 Tax=Lelliottia wanjuensis TaxID=3050585 RepID=A0AAP4D0N6_9ENTR|nr:MULTISPECIES: TA system toxin CbtA family protein [unclassified Lelliottia]MDK9362949.1 TA system toxin CbtA family protein [Lelliottia sp. V106_12]MDK9616566.1 TA system toxin CbtA family protein [Lelliottia sp. V106_9]